MAFPNVKLARRPLHFIYLCDCSGSMRGQKMQSLNQAIRQTLPAMAEVASDNPEAQLLVRAVRFSDRAEWHIAQPTPVEELQHAWQDLEAYGLTSMGEAMTLVAEVLRTPPMEQRALPPVLVLISDGAPTDDYYAGLQKLFDEPWARKAVRLAIAIGHDAAVDELQKFIGPEGNSADTSDGQALRPLQANDARTLARYIKWASTAVVNAASRPVSEIGGDRLPSSQSNIPIPDLPPTLMDPTDMDQVVW